MHSLDEATDTELLLIQAMKDEMPKRIYHNGTSTVDQVFVFGSNLQGDHAGGAAKFAVDFRGARMAQGQGYASRWVAHERTDVKSYALPTMAMLGVVLTLEGVQAAVTLFKVFAYVNENLTFFVTPVGCGIAGFKHEDIAPMFADAPLNCLLPPEWKAIIE